MLAPLTAAALAALALTVPGLSSSNHSTWTADQSHAWGLCSELFEMLAPLEERTRPLTAAARAALAASKGHDALEPWNLSYALSGAPPAVLGLLPALLVLPRRLGPDTLAPCMCASVAMGLCCSLSVVWSWSTSQRPLLSIC